MQNPWRNFEESKGSQEPHLSNTVVFESHNIRTHSTPDGELTAVGGSTVALPLEGDKVGQVVLEAHAVASCVTPIVHFATPAK